MQLPKFYNILLHPFRGRGLTRLNLFRGRGLLLAFLVVHTIVSFYYISQHNITFDEPDYIEYAKHWLHGKPERIQPLDDSKSPIVAVAWIPRTIRQILNPNYELHDYGRKDQKEGRYIMILFSFVAALYMYWWCKDLYGQKGWYLPLLMLLFDPLYLAYSSIIGTDLASGAFLVALLYHYRKYLLCCSRKHFYLSAFFTGLGIVTKQNLLFTFLLLPILSIVYYVSAKSARSLFSRRNITDVLLFVVVILLIINVSYYFHKSFIPFGQYNFESRSLQNLQSHLTFLHWFPLPLPEAFIQSTDMLKAHAELGAGKPGSTYNGIYLFHTLKLSGNFWYYYFVQLWYKMPIGTMFLFLCCVFLMIKNFRKESFIEQYMFLLVPVIFYLIVLTFFNQFKSGLRHLLLIFPLFYIGLGYLFQQVYNAALTYKIVIGAAIVYTFITVGVYYPYIIPYTNEFIINKKMVYRKIWDSSIDYGQSDSSVKQFVVEHPTYKRASSVPDTGKYAVLMGEMVNTYLRNANPYKWYQAFEPKGNYMYTILLFDIKKEDLDKADWKKAELEIIP